MSSGALWGLPGVPGLPSHVCQCTFIRLGVKDRKRKFSLPQNAFWGISEDTWVEGIAWVATGVLAVGLIYMLNRAAPPPPPPKA